MTTILIVIIVLLILYNNVFKIKIDTTRDLDDSIVFIIYYYWKGCRHSKIITTNIKIWK